MSKNPHWREHRIPIAFPVEFLVGLSYVENKYQITRFPAALRVICEGLYREQAISEETYLLFKRRYERKAIDIANEGRKENSHLAKIEIERQIAKEETQKERKYVDYSSFSLEDLEKVYLNADFGPRQAILFALKKKGVDIRAFQRQQEGVRR